MSNISTLSVEKCTGCSACESICPRGAIRMQPDAEGFSFPVVDETRCTQCGECLRACPAENPAYTNGEQPAFYAFRGAEDIRKASSSGGAFTYLSEWVLENNGAVCGAVFSGDCLSVRHVLIETKAELGGMRQSKYIQSDVGSCFHEIKALLENDRYVLFSGCPCQVAGLKAALGREHDKLLLVDVVCNSAPSPLAWRAYVSEAAGGRSPVYASFRDKSLGLAPKVRMLFDDKTEFIEDGGALPWMSPFVNGITTRKSCHACRFARMSRQGDITLGDFWDINAIDPALNDGGGTSMISVNNPKGRLALNRALDGKEAVMLREAPFHTAVNNIPSRYYRGQNRHPGRNAFFEALRGGGSYSRAIRAAMERRYDFGIMGWWFGKNYGAVLTSLALYKTVERLGYHSVLIDTSLIYMDGVTLNYDNFVKSKEFIYKHCDTTLSYASTEQLDSLNDECDGFIVGSDQLFLTWNGQLTDGSAKYYLDYAYDNRTKLAYGTSFGHDRVDMNALDKEIAKYYLSRFNAVSSRESAGASYIRDELELPAELVLDPALLLDKDEYAEFCDEATCANETAEPYIFAHIIRYSKEIEDIIKLFSERTGMRVITALAMNEDARSDSWTIPCLGIISVEDWIFYLSHAEYVLTDSFHGMCFSILFEKTFIGFKPWMGPGRFRSLAELTGLENRILCDLPYVEANMPALLEKTDYAPVLKRLEEERKKSIAYLTNALSSAPKGSALSDYDIMRLRCGKYSKEVDARFLEMISRMEGLQAQVNGLSERANGLQGQITGIRQSKSYRVGRMITYIPRKIRGGVKCLKDNGVKYTIVHLYHKIVGRIKNG